ncbi:MAG: Flp pilus assembly protein CpaB [Methyloligellaceae bacterium]
MRLGNIIMLGAALVFGLAAALLAKIWLENQTPAPVAKQERPAVAMRTLVVAAKPLRFGMELSPSHLTEIEWPEKAIPKGAFAKISDIMSAKGRRIVLSAIARNEPVLREKITGPGQRATLSALVAEGMRAVAISVNDVLGVAGFVLPGERVDILLTRSEKKEVVNGPSQTIAYTDVLLQNVRVLAVDQLADDRSAKPSLVKTVTIEVNAEQAQKVALGAQVGVLSLALRSAGYTGADAARRISLADLRSDRAVAVQKARAAARKDSGHVSIGVTRAVEREQYSVPREAAPHGARAKLAAR